MPVQVKTVGLEKLLKKLDATELAGEEKARIMRESGEAGRDFLSPRIPRETGASASTMGLRVTDEFVRLSVTAFPLRFQEFGTRYIKPKKFMARTIGKVRRDMKSRVQDAVPRIERKWSS